MRMIKRLTLIIMIFSLLMTSGCQSPEKKLQKLQQQTEELIGSGKYEEAIEVCDKALNSDSSSEDIYPLIERIYTEWAMQTMTVNGTSITPSLQIIDQMIERYPDLKDKGENIILDLGEWTLESYGEDVEGMRKVFDGFISLYPESDIICYGIDAKFREVAEEILTRKTNELIDNGLLEDIDNDAYETVFAKIDEFRLYCYTMVLNYHFVFPYVRQLDNGMSLKIEYVNSFFTMYFGQLDDQGQKTGEAVQLTYAVNMKEQEKYQEEYLRGQFRDDMVNGEFKEYIYKCIDDVLVALNIGKMLDSRYDGEVKSHYERGDSIQDYIFIFENGVVVPYGRMIDYPGYYGVGIDTTSDLDKTDYFSYKEDSLKIERGLYPFYRSLY